ncbi:hypothetical protein [Cellulomonas palmilytica]|uniref:hypothetical protein n=1 Tax=Cellulomonas palmilytica TaxID=2608402 RepID=UPI001F3BAE88|nr:hypothetical protein [Cellulomonas palmilytica]UJP40573.1 hypothetical protein F1D97_03435 [Cellulomonas palmilytica]
MARDLNEFLQAVADADERSLDGLAADGPLERARRGVRRRRVVRHTQTAALCVAAVAALAGGALLADSDRGRPVDPATHGVTQGPLVETPGIPPYRALTPDVLSEADAGWVLSVHLAEPSDPEGVRDPGGDVVLLTSPEGDSYRVPGVAPGSQLEVLTWDGSDETAVVRQVVDGSGQRALLDLADGTVTPDARGLAPDSDFVGRVADGELWYDERFVVLEDDGGRRDVYDAPRDSLSLVDPTGHRMIGSRDDLTTSERHSYDVVDLETGDVDGPYPLVDGDETCDVAAWLDASTLLARCAEGTAWDEGFDEVEIDLSGDEPTRTTTTTVGPQDPYLLSAQWLADGVLVGDTFQPGDVEACGSMGTYLRERDGSLTVVEEAQRGLFLATVPQTADGLVYVKAEQGCNGEQAPSTLTVHDPATGAAHALLPFPVDNRGDRPGMLSWTIAR